MIKVLTLLLTFIFAVASVGGYLYLDEKIIAGEKQVADGQKEVDKGQPVLEKGKATLEAGKLALSEGKMEYEKAHDNLVMVFLDKLFNSGKGFEEGRKQIAEGDKKVAMGEAKINAGEKRLAVGELQLLQGREHLKRARSARSACALGALFFGVLSIVLTILWWKTLVRICK